MLYPLALDKTSNPKDRIHLFEVYIFCDLFVANRKSPSCPKAMDAINRVAETQLKMLPPTQGTTEKQNHKLYREFSF